MATEYKPTIDFSTFPDSDGEPMAENDANRIQMGDLIFALQRLFSARDDVYVGGNLLVYYNPANGLDHLSPDVFVAFGVAPGLRHSWRTWVEGKFPDVVFEITSPSTMDVDLGRKVEQYARLGAREYYIYDPAARIHPAFQGYELANGRYLAMAVGASGSVTSPLIEAELRPVGAWLRVIDSGTGEPVPVPAELDARLQTTEARATAAEAEARALRAELARVRRNNPSAG